MNRQFVFFIVALGFYVLGFSSSGVIAQDLGDPKIGLRVDEAKLRANRIRKITSTHLTLFTDLPADKEVDELGKVFDQAVNDWKSYFKVSDVSKFHATGFLIKDKNRFIRASVVPQALPDFKNGYTYGLKTFWMYDQPSHFMRRQLMIHEGTHTFLFSNFGANIAPWYNEGMAEWFAAHQWANGKLKTGITIRHRDDAPFWGRTKMIRDSIANRTAYTFAEVRNLPNNAFLKTDPYGWVWAAATFMNTHPQYQEPFAKLSNGITANGINAAFDKTFARHSAKIEEQWSAFLHDLDYGVDGSSTQIEYQEAKTERNSLRTIEANKSWQNSGVEVKAGAEYLIRSKGRFVIRESMINQRKTAWPCEPNGVTIEYYRGQPLGKLMAVIKPVDPDSKIDFDKQIPIGLTRQFKSPVSGTLYLRVNESPSGLHDNSGSFLINVVPK